MRLLENKESEERGYYLPSHAVLKDVSITTKTRVVFDASCNSSTGISLNDTLKAGHCINVQASLIVKGFPIRVICFEIEKKH